MDVTRHNREAWDRQVAAGNPWTIPVGAEEIARARRGQWRVLLTPTRPVPRDWFGELLGARVLCLASGGGQQGPVLAAAGASVIVLDNSPEQLGRDRQVAERDGLDVGCELGTMTDLSRFGDGAFDLVFHPVSNLFVPDVRPVWREAFRVLRSSGRLLAGFCNPLLYIFDAAAEDRGEVVVRHPLPYSDLDSLTPEELAQRLAAREPIEYSHSLEEQIGGQLEAGFVLTGLYEDGRPGSPLDRLAPMFLATLAVKPPPGGRS
jgi:SAM-dependent methyltransferase